MASSTPTYQYGTTDLPAGFPSFLLSQGPYYYTDVPSRIPLPPTSTLTYSVGANGQVALLVRGGGYRLNKFNEFQRRDTSGDEWRIIGFPTSARFREYLGESGTTAQYRARAWEGLQRPGGTYPTHWSAPVTVTVPASVPGDDEDPDDPDEPEPAPAVFDWPTALAAARLGTAMRRQAWGSARWLTFEQGEGDTLAVCVLHERSTATVNGVLRSSVSSRPLSAGDFGLVDYEALDWVEA